MPKVAYAMPYANVCREVSGIVLVGKSFRKLVEETHFWVLTDRITPVLKKALLSQALVYT